MIDGTRDGVTTDIVLIRHAPVAADGRPLGRRDLPCFLPDDRMLARVRAAAGPVGRLLTSPALRCRATAEALFPDLDATPDPRLWEQDFGAWERSEGYPDLGSLPAAELARQRPPEGESFEDLCARLAPALRDAAVGGQVTLVAHAGTVRGALAHALGAAGPALAFEVAPLSLTLLRALPGGGFSVGYVNRIPG